MKHVWLTDRVSLFSETAVCSAYVFSAEQMYRYAAVTVLKVRVCYVLETVLTTDEEEKNDMRWDAVLCSVWGQIPLELVNNLGVCVPP